MAIKTDSSKKIKASFLVQSWDTPMDTRLVKKQFSIRMPILIAAKINALAELYPMMNKTSIISGLLSLALSEVEEEIPAQKGADSREEPFSGEKVFKVEGLRGRFEELVLKHLRELEKEAGFGDDPLEFFHPYWKESSFKED